MRRLRAFQSVELEPCQSRTVTFTVGTDDLRFVGRDGRWVLELGAFDVMVGGLTGTFRVTAGGARTGTTTTGGRGWRRRRDTSACPTAAAGAAASATGGLAGAVAQLRERGPGGYGARHRAARIRTGRHALRPGEQLWARVRLGGGNVRAHPAARPGRRTATSWSSAPRRGTACGPAPTATAARASTCCPAWTRACGGWASSTWTSSTITGRTPTRRWRSRWARWSRPSVPERRCTWACRIIRPPSPPGRQHPAGDARAVRAAPAAVQHAGADAGGVAAPHAGGRGHRLHRLLAAGAGAADGSIPGRHPGGFARRQAARIPARGRGDGCAPYAAAGAERHCAGAGAEPGAAGDRVGRCGIPPSRPRSSVPAACSNWRTTWPRWTTWPWRTTSCWRSSVCWRKADGARPSASNRDGAAPNPVTPSRLFPRRYTSLPPDGEQ